MAIAGVTHNVYRNATAPVPMDDAHRIASGLRVGLYLDRGGRAGLYYVVTAQNAAGESGPSNTVQAEPLWPWPPKPWPPRPPEPPSPPPFPPALKDSRWPDLLLLLPAPLLLLALGRSRRRMRWAAPVGVVLMVIAVICVGAALLSGRGAEAEEPVPVQFQQQPEGYLTRTITYTYDPLGRLTGAEYSTGERFEYQYDALSNVTVMTETITTTIVTHLHLQCRQSTPHCPPQRRWHHLALHL